MLPSLPPRFDRSDPDRAPVEPALPLREARYRALAHAVGQIVWTTAPDGQVEDMPEWRAYTGQTLAAVRGWGWLDAVHPDDAARTQRVWEAAVAARGVYDTEYRIRGADGAYRWFHARGVPVLAPHPSPDSTGDAPVADGRIVEWVGCCIDIDARRRAEAEGARARAALEATNVQLHAQQLEVALQNQQLQEQAAELEAQAVELEATAAELEEQTAKAEAERARATGVLEATADAYFALDADFRIVAVNGAMERGSQLSRHALLGRVFWELFPGTVGTAFERHYRAAVTEQAESHFTHDYSDGRLALVVEADVYPATGGGVVTFWRDVTERERLLAADRAAARRIGLLQALTAAFSAALTPEAVVHVLLEHGIPALGATTGLVMLLSADGTYLTSIGAQGYPPAMAARFARLPLDAGLPVAAVVREGRSLWITDTDAAARMYADVGPIYASVGSQATAALPLADAGGRVIGALAFNYATPQAFDPESRAFKEAVARQCAQALERARLFAAERAARSDAEAANRSKSQFLANMSHELRTPLNAIGGYTQLLELGLHGPVTDAQRDALGRVQRAQHRLLGLINDVLNYAKLESGRVEYDLQVVDVREVITDVAPLLEPQLVAKGLTLDVRLPEGPDAAAACAVWTDREKLGQVLVNLLSNAVKFTAARHPETGVPGRVMIDVATRVPMPRDPVIPGEEADAVYLRVSDTGRGIPRDRQDAIFEPFVQVRTGYAQATEGTGLGLAISRDLARGMGGDLRVRSRAGEGATFTVTLRRAPSGLP